MKEGVSVAFIADTAATIPDLPEEVIEHVVNELSESLTALKACSLASKTFCNLVRPHIHSQFTFNAIPDDIDRLSHYADTPPLIEYIQGLILNHPGITTTTTADFRSALRRLGTLPNVRSLKIHGVNFMNDEGQELYSLITSMLPRVRSLTVDNRSAFYDINHLSSLIHSFPLVQNLDLGYIAFKRSASTKSGDGAKAEPKILGLHSLRLLNRKEFRKEEIIKLLRIDPNLERGIPLESLTIYWPRVRYSVDSIDYDLYELFGPSLRHLRLEIGDNSHGREGLFSKCVNLETLYIEVARRSDRNYFRMASFRQMGSLHLKKLILRPKANTLERITDTFVPEDLDDELRKGGYSVDKILFSLSIEHRMSSSLKSIMAEVEECMPWSWATGGIEFEYASD